MRMTKIARRFVLIAALALAGCVGAYDGVPKFGGEATLPPLAPGLSRLVFYRQLEYYDVELGTTVYLNQQPVGFLRIGETFYRDMPPGSYLVLYFRIESLLSMSCDDTGTCRGDTFVVNVIDPAIGRQESFGLASPSN
jgi:hypothetical protein